MTAAILQLSGLGKSFGPLEVLRGVDLSVVPRELVFIIGPSGSGKSTLLRCCNRLEEPSCGQVVVNGENILDPGVDINRVRRGIGMVFQSFNLYPHMTALGNVTLALRRVLKLSRTEAGERGQAALARVALPELLHQARIAQGITYNPTPLIAAAVIYFLLLWPLVRVLSRLERRMIARH